MDWSSILKWQNQQYLDELFARYAEHPHSVSQEWASLFSWLQQDGKAAQISETGRKVEQVIHAYRKFGHFAAKLDPLGLVDRRFPGLELAEIGFASGDSSKKVGKGDFLGPADGTLSDLVAKLKQVYSEFVGIEYAEIPELERVAWIRERIEPHLNTPDLSADESKRILAQLVTAESFERFLQTRYVGHKRFSAEGAEAIIPLLEAVIDEGAELGAKEFVLGMAHRGRLNVLAHVMNKPYELILSEFEGTAESGESASEGDVKYHQGYSSDKMTSRGRKVHLSLSFNPSHLEVIDPVMEGIVRSKQDDWKDTERKMVIPILLHGDASFTGQGVVNETLNLSQLEPYRTGGTIHVIINNQLGFTATAEQTRFTAYPSDCAKTIPAPIFHVNGDHPDHVVHAAKLAVQYRQQFGSDVILDIWCYRRYGHNEQDDPTFTQPMMYNAVHNHPSVVELYSQDTEEITTLREATKKALTEAMALAKEVRPRQRISTLGGKWEGLSREADWGDVDTKVPEKVIEEIANLASEIPSGFEAHPKIEKLYQLRKEMGQGKKGADWGCAEMFALGSLLMEGTPVRLTGQDVERGTFSHRHAVWHDTKKPGLHVPLNHLSDKQASLTIANTMLSELGVVGFEYGFSTANPRNLVMWEAQFGDFVNMAQPIIDQFLVAGEAKWKRMSGLVMLLPHGFEGQGPEHSSARFERFLQLSAENNIQVCYPTTPAQYFHLLRGQIKRNFRKPLILMMPKSLLRLEAATSPREAFTDEIFSPVLDDPEALDKKTISRVILCTGKVFYTLGARRAESKGTAIVRVERLYPFPEAEIAKALEGYKKATEILWVQEEPQNMGAWTFVEPRLRKILGDKANWLSYVGRPESASVATGSHKFHDREERKLVEKALALSEEPKK